MSPETEDYRAELFVGRIPWDAPEQIAAMLDAMILYGEDESPRMKRALGAAATISTPCDAALWLEQAKKAVLIPAGYRTTTLYEDCPAANPDLELSRAHFVGQWNLEEPGLVAWFSHGNPFGSYYEEAPYTFVDVENMPENVGPAVCLTSGCTVGAPDEESLGRRIVQEGACAAFLGSSRITFYGTDPVPAFTAQFKISTSLISNRRAVAEAKITSIQLRESAIPCHVSVCSGSVPPPLYKVAHRKSGRDRRIAADAPSTTSLRLRSGTDLNSDP